jgi:hypothetical protein
LIFTADLTRHTRTANLIFLYLIMLITYDDKNKLWVSHITPPSSFRGNQVSRPYICHSFWSSELQLDSKKGRMIIIVVLANIRGTESVISVPLRRRWHKN